MLSKVNSLFVKLSKAKGDSVLEAETYERIFQIYRKALTSATFNVVDIKRGYIFEVPKQKINVLRLQAILQEITPLKFEINYFTDNDFNPEDKLYIQPYKRQLCPIWWAEIQKDASTQTMIGAQSNFPQLLFSAITAAIRLKGLNWVKNNIFLRKMKHYIMQTPKDEPFRERGKGQVVPIDDAMAATRCLLLLRSFMLSVDGKYPHKVLEEVSDFLFKNPYKHQSFIKSNTTILKQSSFDLSTEGSRISWKNCDYLRYKQILSDFEEAPIFGNDKFHYKKCKSSIEDEVKNLREKGLNELANAFINLISAPVTKENLNIFTCLYHCFYLCGFMRTDTVTSVINQTSFGTTLKADFTGETFLPYITEQWSDIVHKFATDTRFKAYSNERDVLRQIPSVLTNKSAGMGPIRFSVSTEKRRPTSQYNSATKLWDTNFSLSDKIGHFYRDPMKVIYKNEHSFIPTEDNPWPVGIRYVPGKPTRGIFVVPLKHFIHDSALIPYVLDVTMRKEEVAPHPIMCNAAITFGSESGINFLDHMRGVAASGDPTVLIKEMDFSKFDSTQRTEVRQAKIDGIKEGFQRANINYNNPFFGYKNIEEMLVHTQEIRKKVYLKVKDKTFVYDGLLSGEFDTIYYNTVTNRAFARAFMREATEKLPDLFKSEKLMMWLFQGDDSVNFAKLGDGYDYKLYIQSQELMSKVAEKNGLDLNYLKTVVRSYFYEYLQKKAIYGWFVEAYMSTSLTSGEKRSVDQSPIPVTRGLISTASTMVSRGWGQTFLLYFIKSFFCLKSSIKMYTRRDELVQRWFKLPHIVLHLPFSQGGCGLHFDTLMYPMSDGAIAFKAMKDKKLRHWVNSAIYVLDVPPSTIRKDMAEAMFVGKNTKPSDFFARGREFVERNVKIEKKTIEAAAAVRRLKRAGAPVPRDTYLNFERHMIINMLSSNPSVGGLEAQEKDQNGNLYASRIKGNIPDALMDMYGWLDSLEIEWGEELKMKTNICPFVVWDEPIQDLFRYMGISRSKDVFDFNPERLLAFLRKDPNFPRYFTAEMVFKLISKPSIGLFPERVFSTLVALGLDSKIASAAISELKKKGQEYIMMTQGNIVSSNDQIMGVMDLSQANYERLVDCPPLSDDIMKGIVHSLVLSVSVHRFFKTGKMQRAIIKMNDKSISSLKASFTKNKRKYAVLKHMDIYAGKTRELVQ